jgi:hypothetical protein
MILRPLHYDLTPEDRLTRARWARGVVIFYSCVALLIFAAIAIVRPSVREPHGSTNLAAAPSESPSVRLAADKTPQRCPSGRSGRCSAPPGRQ